MSLYEFDDTPKYKANHNSMSDPEQASLVQPDLNSQNPPAGALIARLSLWLIGAMLVLPYLQYLHDFPIPGFYSEWLAFALGLAAITLLICRPLWQMLAIPHIALLPLLMTALLLLHWMLGTAPYSQQILIAIEYTLWAFLLVCLGSLLGRNLGIAQVVKFLAWCLVAGTSISAIFAILQHYNIHTIFDHVISAKRTHAAYANIGQPNHLANYLSLGLGSLFYLMATSRLKWMVGLAAAIVLLWAIALTGSRSVWLYLTTIAILAVWLYRRHPDRNSKTVMLQAILLLPIFLGIHQLALWLVPAEIVSLSVADNRLFDVASGATGRLPLWREAWLMFLNSPLMGAGFGQFAWNHFEFATLYPEVHRSGQIYSHAHNLILHLLAELGLPAVLLLLVTVGLWMRAVIKQPFTVEQWWVFVLLSVIGIHSMLEYPLWYSYFLGLAAFLLGLAETRNYTLTLRPISKLSLLSILLLGWLSAVNFLYSYLQLHRVIDQAARATQQKFDIEQAYATLLRLHKESMLTPYVEFTLANLIELNRENIADKIEINEKVMRFAPLSTVVYRHAFLLALSGDLPAAQQQLNHAMAAYADDAPGMLKILRRLESKEPMIKPLIQSMADRLNARR